MDNKLWQKILAYIWFAVAFILFVLLINGLKNHSLFPYHNMRHIFRNERMFKNSDNNFEDNNFGEYRFSFDADDINEIDIDVISETVKVTQYSGSKIEIVINSQKPKENRPYAIKDNNKIKITTDNPLRNMLRTFDYSGTIQVFIPANVQLHEFDCSTISGSISVDSLFIDKIKLNSVSGSIRAENCDIGIFNANSTSGSIHYEGILNSFDTETVSGSVHIQTNKMISRDCSAKSLSGSIKIYLPQNDGFDLQYETISGTITNEFSGNSISKGNGHLNYKSGGPEIETQTISGSITIQK